MNTLTSVILSALQDTRDMGLTVEERAEAIADAVREGRPVSTKEPEVIAELRGWHREGCESLFTIGEVLAVDIADILAAYDAIVDERDAAIAECHEQARLNGMGSEREAKLMAERDALTARLAACERVVEAAEAWADHDDDGGAPDQALWQAVCELRLVRDNT